MDTGGIGPRGLVLLGCGRMGGAMLAGWLDRGLAKENVWVVDPNPSDWLEGLGVHLNEGVPDSPAVALIAVKPQMMSEALPSLAARGGGDTRVISVAAGTPIAAFEAVFGAGTPIVRAMPNTPAAVGRGITAIVGNARAGDADLDTAQSLLRAVGQVVRLEDEAQMEVLRDYLADLLDRRQDSVPDYLQKNPCTAPGAENIPIHTFLPQGRWWI